jgi:type II secretory pathway pseudopilin PulG
MDGLRMHRDQRGMTLSELLVGMGLTAIITLLVLGAVVVVNRTQRYSDEDSGTLAALRTAETRFAKDLRQARRVFSISDAKKIRFWVDFNRDFLQDIGERVSWELQAVDGKAQLIRYTDAPLSEATIQVRNLVYSDTFSYVTTDGSPGTATLVSITLTANAAPTGIAKDRSIVTEVRLRNADPTASTYQTQDDGAGHWSEEDDNGSEESD